jgi:hypothetical protein
VGRQAEFLPERRVQGETSSVATRLPVIIASAWLVGGCLSQSVATSTSVVRIPEASPGRLESERSDGEASADESSSSAGPRLPLDLVALPAATTATRYENGARGHLENPERVVDRHRPEFRRCFEHAAASGQVSLAIEVDDQGSVSRARGEALGPVPREVVRCVERRAHTMRFEAPRGGRVELPISVVYLRQ